MASDFSTRYLCQWSETLRDIDAFRELVGDKLFEDLDPIFTELSIRSGCEYIDWLYEARAEICMGRNPYEVLSHYNIVLKNLRGKNYV